MCRSDGEFDVVWETAGPVKPDPYLTTFGWSATAVNAALVALSDYESPTTLKLLLDTHAHGVITKPFRSAGIFSTLVLARSSHSFQERQQGKIEKLEATMKSRRQIEKAVRVLSESQNMTETQAY